MPYGRLILTNDEKELLGKQMPDSLHSFLLARSHHHCHYYYHYHHHHHYLYQKFTDARGMREKKKLLFWQVENDWTKKLKKKKNK